MVTDMSDLARLTAKLYYIKLRLEDIEAHWRTNGWEESARVVAELHAEVSDIIDQD